MYNTLRAAMGTWPSENAYTAEAEDYETSRSDLNERFDFHTNTAPLASEVLQVNSEKNPQEAMENLNGSEPTSNQTEDPSMMMEDGSPPPGEHEQEMDLDYPYSRSPSPLPDPDLEAERSRLWSQDARKGFHAMVTEEKYVNRYRMHMKKVQRMSHYLDHPDLDPHLCDGSKDHQTKYQAVNWTLIDGKLCRKPESGRVGKLRRHIDEIEAWEVITAEHVRSGHAGRDRLRKRLEGRYIGYTLQEIMFVLKECKRCNGDRGATVEMVDADEEEAEKDEANGVGEERQGPFKQTSNMMLF